MNPGYLLIPEEDYGRRRYSKEDWAAILRSLEWVQEIAAQFQGIPSWACWYYQFTRRWLEVPRGLVFSPGGIIMVLGA